MESIEKISEEWVKDNLCKKCSDPQKSQNKCAVCGFYMMSYNCFYNGCLEMQKRFKPENEKLKKDKEYLDKVNNKQTEVILKLNKQIDKMKNKLNCTKYHYCLCKDKNCQNCKDWRLEE